MTSKPFSELGLSEELLKAIDKLGFEQASPIQAEAIPVLLSGRDIVGQSQTGSGKTAAFAIPALEKTDSNLRVPQVLILCPTRELAVQVSEEIHKLAIFKRGIHALPIYGGQSYERQFDGLKRGAQIIIGTPGRVMDHMKRGTLRLDTVKLAVLDEADVMLNMGFREDIEFILQAVPKERQTVFFSATMPRPIRDLIEKYAREPQTVKIEQKAMTVPTVEQVYYEVDRRYKIELLTRLIDIHDYKLGIIFCNTKRMVDDLVDHLEAQGYLADRLHGDMTQAMRDRVMNKFRKSGLEFLVATDIAARGIDVDDVEVVFNYDLPYDGEDYVHRIGRTGRAGRSGRAISFASGRELFQIRNIERYTNLRIQRGRIPTVSEVAEAREEVFLTKVRTLLAGGEFQHFDHLVDRLLEEGYTSTDIASALIHMLKGGEASAPPAKETPQSRPGRTDTREERPPQRRERKEERPPRPTERREASAPARVLPVSPRPVIQSSTTKPSPAPAPVVEPPKPKPGTPAPAVGSPKPKPVPPVVVVEKKPALVEPKPVAASTSAPTPAPAVEKTYSDKEILALVKKPEPGSAKKPTSKSKPIPASAAKPKASRATPEHQTRLWMNIGEEHGITPIDIVNAVSGETGLPGMVVGTVDVRERHLFADVNTENAKAIIARLNRATIRGRRVKVKAA